MMKVKPSIVILCALLGAAPAAAQAWSPDAGNGRYRNPIVFADYSDPDVVRVGDDYYMTASSFNAVPALPILHSRPHHPAPAVKRKESHAGSAELAE